MHRFYTSPDNISGKDARITGQDARHLTNVMRLSVGDRVELADGRGYHHIARIDTVSAKGKEISLTILESRYLQAESHVHITIAQAVLKEKKLEETLRPLTELGMTEWYPFYAKRSIPTPTPKKEAAKLERRRKIVREAMKQCGRSILPEIHPPCAFNDIMTQSEGYDHKVLFWEEATEPLYTLNSYQNETQNSETLTSQRLSILVLIGPEGGITQEEAATAMAHGFSAYTLGPRILRAETAAVTACALIQTFFGDLGNKSLL